MLKNHQAKCSLKTLKPNSCLVTVSPLESGIGHILGFTIQGLVQELESIKITSLKIKLGKNFAYPDTNTEAYIDISIEELLLNLSDIYLSEEGEYVLHANEEGIYDTSRLQINDIPCINLEPKVLFTKIASRPMTLSFKAEQCRGYYTPPQAYDESNKTFFLTLFSSPFFLRDYQVKPYRLSLEKHDQLELTIYRKTEVPVEVLLTYIADRASGVIKEEIQDLIALDDKLLIKQEATEEAPKPVSKVDVLHYTLDQIKISARAFNCLKNASIFTVKELISYSEKALLKVPNFGSKCLAEIKLKLNDLNLSLSSNTPVW